MLDGATIEEFAVAPNDSWEPLGDGEFRSRATFERTGDDRARGSFLGPGPYTRLISYSRLQDLRAQNQLFGELSSGIDLPGFDAAGRQQAATVGLHGTGPVPRRPGRTRRPRRRPRSGPHPHQDDTDHQPRAGVRRLHRTKRSAAGAARDLGGPHAGAEAGEMRVGAHHGPDDPPRHQGRAGGEVHGRAARPRHRARRSTRRRHRRELRRMHAHQLRRRRRDAPVVLPQRPQRRLPVQARRQDVHRRPGRGHPPRAAGGSRELHEHEDPAV